MKVAYLGPEGSFSQQAAMRFAPDGDLVPMDGFYALMGSLYDGGADYIVVPIFNSLNGGVTQNIDLLQANDCIAVKELTLRIDHRLATLKGADLSRINRIYSHSQALEQCAKFLSSHYPRAKLVAVSSTSVGASMVKLPTDAAIASADCGVRGLEFSETSIADNPDNFTHFLLVRRGTADENSSSRHVYFSVTCRHEPGALVKLLNILGEAGINMSRIESRPIKERAGEFRFFIEAEGDYSLPVIKRALDGLRGEASSFRLLGVY